LRLFGCRACFPPHFGLIPPNQSKSTARRSFPPFPSVSRRCSGFCSGFNGGSLHLLTAVSQPLLDKCPAPSLRCAPARRGEGLLHYNLFLAKARPEADFK
jgi:hypothetical protein